LWMYLVSLRIAYRVLEPVFSLLKISIYRESLIKFRALTTLKVLLMLMILLL